MLTARQREMLRFIAAEADAGRSPSYDEIAAAIGLHAKSGINRIINSLVERGYLHHRKARARSLTVLMLPGQEGLIAELCDALEECIREPIETAASDFRRAREIVARARKAASISPPIAAL